MNSVYHCVKTCTGQPSVVHNNFAVIENRFQSQTVGLSIFTVKTALSVTSCLEQPSKCGYIVSNMEFIDKVIDAAYDVTGISLERMTSNLFVVEGKVKNITGTKLSKQWQDSAETDYSIYDGEDYLVELLYCWNCYSGPSAVRLINHLKHEGISIGNSCDYQGGIGMTTALMAEAYPSQIHTVVAGTEEHSFKANSLFEKLGLKNVLATNEVLKNVDLLIAQETFEHFVDPVRHLKSVLKMTKPKYYFDASSFELINSPGHFKMNKYVRTEFNRTLEERGYAVVWRDQKFDEKFDKRKPIEQLPTLWKLSS